MREHYKRIVRDNEQRVAIFLKNQVMDSTAFEYGGLLVRETNMVEPKKTIYRMTTALTLYLNKDSKYYRDPEIFRRVNLALDYISRVQRPDGTFDLLSCNFFAAPDTAFCLKRMLPAYRVLKKFANQEQDQIIVEKLENILRKGAYGIIHGGFHTPNHRWAIASVLMAYYNIFGEERFKQIAQQYLNEGIDCNEDGEYAERSAGNYNRINNDAMMLLAEELGDESYYQYVDRNLNMMFRYFEPDDSVFTNNSTRQDKGKKVYPKEYYFEYLYMAKKRNNPEYAAAANRIMNSVIDRGVRAPDCLSLLMLNPDLIEYEYEGEAVPSDFKVYYRDSGIIRGRQGEISYSVIENCPNFLYFQVGALTAYMKIGMSYFDQREFKSQQLIETAEGYELKYTAKGWYYLPFNEKPDTTDWWKMENSKRDKLLGPDVEITVAIHPVPDGLDVKIKAQGCDRVPVRVEMGFTAGALITSDAFMCGGEAGQYIIARSGYLDITKDTDTMIVGPAFAKHRFVGGYDGNTAAYSNVYTVFFTDYTEFNHTITLRKG